MREATDLPAVFFFTRFLATFFTAFFLAIFFLVIFLLAVLVDFLATTFFFTGFFLCLSFGSFTMKRKRHVRTAEVSAAVINEL